MNVNKTVKNALESLGYTVSPDWVVEGKEKYFAFTYSQRPEDYADDTAITERTDLTVHFFCPYDFDYLDLAEQVKRRLHAAGYSWPTVDSWADPDGRQQEGKWKKYRHVIFECQRLDVITKEGL